MFLQMNNINIIKEEWVKTIRKLYSAVNELLDILGRDVSEWGYDKEKLERKVQAYVNYLGDTKEWEELTKRKDSNEDKDLLLDKVQDDVLDIMSLSTSREDADKARKALRQLSNVTSADVMDVLNSCIDDGWRVGKSTRYAKKKLVMNSVPSIYEKEETNNWADLYYNVVHWRYQILNWDKIYTTKRGGVPKAQEVDPQENWEEKVWVSLTGQIDENIWEIPVVFETVEVADQKEVAEEVVKKHEEAKKQTERVDTMEEQPKEKNKESEEEVEWSEEKVIEELKKIQNDEWFENLQRCNDVELSFLAQQLLKSPETIDLLKKVSLSESEKNLNAEFERILDELLVKFRVNIKYLREWAINLKVKTKEGVSKSFRRIKWHFIRELWINWEDMCNFKNISEYMAFVCFLNNIKNTVISANKKIKKPWNGSLMFLLKWKNSPEEISRIIERYLIPLLIKEKWNFEYSKEEKWDFEDLKVEKYSKKMEELKDEIESDFNSMISKDSKGEYSLTENFREKIKHVVDDYLADKWKNIYDWLMLLLLPTFIKMWIYAKNDSHYIHDWFRYVDISDFVWEKDEFWLTHNVIKYVIKWKPIELKISKLKDFEYKTNPLRYYYYDFKNAVLYAIYKTIKENNDGPYMVDLDEEVSTGDLMFTVKDVGFWKYIFNEDSHWGEDLKKIVDKEDLVFKRDYDVNTWETGESTVGEEWAEVENGDEVAETQADVGESRENREVPEVSSIEFTWEENVEGEWADNTAKNGGDEEEKLKNKKNKRQNNVSEWNDNVKNVTIEDIISFYANNDERAKLKTLKKKGGSDQRDCSKLREDYKIRIIKPGFKKWILIGLKTIADKIGERTGNKINKPYTHKWFDTIVWELARLGWKS